MFSKTSFVKYSMGALPISASGIESVYCGTGTIVCAVLYLIALRYTGIANSASSSSLKQSTELVSLYIGYWTLNNYYNNYYYYLTHYLYVDLCFNSQVR